MKILMVSSEVTPFAKTGGLADVAGALPKELASLDHDVRVMMPFYALARKTAQSPRLILPELTVSFPHKKIHARVYEDRLPGTQIPVYLIDCPILYDRKEIYGEDGRDYPDNDIRFAFFCLAVLETLVGLGWAPHILHCNDWQTGLIPTYLRTLPRFQENPVLSNARILFTIHNMGYQGIFSPSRLPALDLPDTVFSIDGLEFWGNISLLKGGIVFSDHITTVSEQYAVEIQSPEFGSGMEGLLMSHRHRLTGILNGVDYSVWNPRNDPNIVRNYCSEEPEGKADCKADLQRQLELPQEPNVPLIAMITRLDSQKGLDLVVEAMDELLALNAQYVILGTGHPHFHEFLQKTERENPNRFRAILRFDPVLAHRVEAGSDMFLMPSRYEPCGLNQLYSLKYGTVPIVRRTGGLVDTIVPAQPETLDAGTATGFAFTEYSTREMIRAVSRAVHTYHDEPEVWERIQHTGMDEDFSWSRSASLYESLYQQLLSEPPGEGLA